MAASVVNICKPTAITKLNKACVLVVYTISIAFPWSFNTKVGIAILETIAKPHFVILYQWEYFFIGDCIHIANDNKLLLGFH